MDILKVGSSGVEVVDLKGMLSAQGFWLEHQRGLKFTPKLTEAVAYFQQTHLAEDGLTLIIDGQVGPQTRWALERPTGKAQKSNIQNDQQPFGIGLVRKKLLEVALSQHGVKEKPNGSNRGGTPMGGVDKFLPDWCKKEGKKGPAWCCFFVSWVTREAFGRYPLGRRHGSCKAAWAAAYKLGMVIDVKGNDPTTFAAPGDAFVMLRPNGTGHIGFVYRVNNDGTMFNTIEGNCGNQVKIGTRSIYQKSFRGYINFFGDVPIDFDRGLIGAADVARERTR